MNTDAMATVAARTAANNQTNLDLAERGGIESPCRE
jgi:hypothetical protein